MSSREERQQQSKGTPGGLKSQKTSSEWRTLYSATDCWTHSIVPRGECYRLNRLMDIVQENNMCAPTEWRGDVKVRVQLRCQNVHLRTKHYVFQLNCSQSSLSKHYTCLNRIREKFLKVIVPTTKHRALWRRKQSKFCRIQYPQYPT